MKGMFQEHLFKRSAPKDIFRRIKVLDCTEKDGSIRIWKAAFIV